MKAYLINTHLLVPRSRSSAKVKIKYQGHAFQKMDASGALVFHIHLDINVTLIFTLTFADDLDLSNSRCVSRCALIPNMSLVTKLTLE